MNEFENEKDELEVPLEENRAENEVVEETPAIVVDEGEAIPYSEVAEEKAENTASYEGEGFFNEAEAPVFYPIPENQAKPKTVSTGLRVFCAIMALVVFTAMGASVGYLIGYRNSGSIANSSTDSKTTGRDDISYSSGTTPKSSSVKAGADGKYTASQVATLVSPSVVLIYVYTDKNEENKATYTGSASGIIMDKNGYILTNDHIYSGVSKAKFVIILSDGRELDADYVAGDLRSDLAVLKIKNPSNLTPAVFGNSDNLSAGDDVIAIGSPDGLSDTVTKGIVSAVNRRVSGGSGTTTQSRYTMKCIQTDTAINPGNSGGALVNLYGQVIGVNSSKIVDTTVEGIGFAIPINSAIKIANSLVKYDYVINRSRLGISYNLIDTLESKISSKQTGLYISEIASDSDLNNKGISTGDIIKQINGKDIKDSDVVLNIIESTKPGETINLTIYVNSTKTMKTVTVKLIADKGSSSYNTAQEQTTTLNKNNPFGN